MALSNLANASNEKREQTIMRLRQAFKQQRVVTVALAIHWLGVTRATLLKYCRDGDIPLFDETTQDTVVLITAKNRPAWLV